MTYVKTLNLYNFRNHENLNLTFGEGINIILGGNALGKTNILESIYLLDRGRSFRSSDSKELIKWGEETCRVEAAVEKACGTDSAIAHIGEKKTFKLNGKNKRSIDIGIVLFVPQDIIIFRDLPKERRDYLDDFISGLDIIYRKQLRDYQKVLRQRNRVLKEGQERGFAGLRETLEVWDERLIECGSEIILKRFEWIDRINEALPETYQYMGGVGSSATLEYIPYVNSTNKTIGEIRRVFSFLLEEKRDLEEIRGLTLVGPQRDDWEARLGERSLKSFGSQGQMRMMALSLKVVELTLHKEIKGEAPLLLLDDVISELDDESSKKLLDFVSKMDGQVFITSTEKEKLKDKITRESQVFLVS